MHPWLMWGQVVAYRMYTGDGGALPKSMTSVLASLNKHGNTFLCFERVSTCIVNRIDATK